MSDQDGFNEHTIMESADPIMSPAWSPDSRQLAYVSFEGNQSSIFVQTLRTGNRFKVSSKPGINGAPSFSPDGRKLVVTLGGVDGNLDIYVLDINSRRTTASYDAPGNRYRGYLVARRATISTSRRTAAAVRRFTG